MKRNHIAITSLLAFSFAYKVYAKCVGNETQWALNLVQFEQISGPVATAEEAVRMQSLWQDATVRLTDFDGNQLSLSGGEFAIVDKNP